MRIKLSVFLVALCLPFLVGAQQTVTPNLGLQMPAYQQKNWQVPLNYDLTLLDALLAGTQNLAIGTTTPTISESANWVTANTSSTIIANFLGGVPGQPLHILCGSGDEYTAIVASANINVSGPWVCSISNSISFVLIGAVWQETARAGGPSSNYLLLSGGILTGELITNASTVGSAGLNLPLGTAPSSPQDGDLWTTTGGLYARIAGSTVGPFGTGGSMVYPAAGIAVSNGSAWITSYSTSGSGNVCLTVSCSMTTPSIGVATATSVNGLTLTANATGFSIAGGTTSKTLTVTTTGTLGTGAFATIANYAPLAGATFTGKVTTVASGTGAAGLNLPAGTAPTSPVNGDLWTTSAGLYARINGATVGPFGTGGSGGMVYPTGTGVAVVTGGASWGTTLATSGSGSVCLTTNCVMTTPNLGTPTALTLTSATGLPLATGVTGTLPVAKEGTGTPASGKYVDGGTGAWTALPTNGVTEATWSTTFSGAVYAFAVTTKLGQTLFTNSHTLIRFTIYFQGAFANCSTAPVYAVRDYTSSSNLATLTMSTAYWYDSGVLSVAMTAGDQIGFYVQTAGVGCNAGSGPVFTMIYQ